MAYVSIYPIRQLSVQDPVDHYRIHQQYRLQSTLPKIHRLWRSILHLWATQGPRFCTFKGYHAQVCGISTSVDSFTRRISLIVHFLEPLAEMSSLTMWWLIMNAVNCVSSIGGLRSSIIPTLNTMYEWHQDTSKARSFWSISRSMITV